MLRSGGMLLADSTDTVLRRSKGAVLKERQTELLRNANENERGEVPHLVTALRHSHHCIVLRREKRALFYVFTTR